MSLSQSGRILMRNKVHKEKRASCTKACPTKKKSGFSREWCVKLETRPDATWQERCQSVFVTWWEPCLGVSNNSDASSENKIFRIAVGKISERERITMACRECCDDTFKSHGCVEMFLQETLSFPSDSQMRQKKSKAAPPRPLMLSLSLVSRD